MKRKDKSGKYLASFIKSVLAYAETHTHAATMRKFDVCASTFYLWKRKAAR